MLEKSMAAGSSTIISGRAGSGKTALAVDFAHRCGRPVAWYKVDAPDADPKIFFRYLIRSIQERRPGFGTKSLMPLVEAAELDLIAWLTEAFVYELAEGESANPLLIVIEDLHLVSDSDWLMLFFGRLLPLLPIRSARSDHQPKFAARAFVENAFQTIFGRYRRGDAGFHPARSYRAI